MLYAICTSLKKFIRMRCVSLWKVELVAPVVFAKTQSGLQKPLRVMGSSRFWLSTALRRYASLKYHGGTTTVPH